MSHYKPVYEPLPGHKWISKESITYKFISLVKPGKGDMAWFYTKDINKVCSKYGQIVIAEGDMRKHRTIMALAFKLGDL